MCLVLPPIYNIIIDHDNYRFVFSAIFEILPELERFLREELAKEQLSEEANAKREEFISKLAALNRAPDLPPRGSGKPATTFVDIREQRELSWRLMPGAFPQASVPYASRKRHTSDDAFNVSNFVMTYGCWSPPSRAI